MCFARPFKCRFGLRLFAIGEGRLCSLQKNLYRSVCEESLRKRDKYQSVFMRSGQLHAYSNKKLAPYQYVWTNVPFLAYKSRHRRPPVHIELLHTASVRFRVPGKQKNRLRDFSVLLFKKCVSNGQVYNKRWIEFHVLVREEASHVDSTNL